MTLIGGSAQVLPPIFIQKEIIMLVNFEDDNEDYVADEDSQDVDTESLSRLKDIYESIALIEDDAKRLAEAQKLVEEIGL